MQRAKMFGEVIHIDLVIINLAKIH